MSRLTPEQQARLLGAVPSPESAQFMAAAFAAPPMLAAAPAFAAQVDWRNRGGNHVSPVKNQGGCGSCVSFGTSALIESMAHIETGRWVDLSEADSHFCSSHGANCSGWWPDQCLDQVIARGISDEAGFPYASAFPGNNIWAGPPVCRLAPNRATRITKINARHALANETAAKNHLTNIGPVTGCFDVYQDFFNYSGGVYHHVSGAKVGGHCVLVIGYSEAEQCWIIKNSWDVSWGSGGFGKIAYADLKFNGQFFPMYGATGVKLPQSGWQPLGGKITTKPVTGVNKDGRIEVFARGTDNALYHMWQTSPGGPFSGWASLGGILTSAPAVVSNADGRLEVFVRGTDGGLHHIWQVAPNSGWSGWAPLGGVITSDPTAVRNADGRVAVFARGSDGALWQIRQGGPQAGWTAWSSLGVQFKGNPVAANNADGRIEVFMLSAGGALIHVWQVVPNGAFGPWASRGGVLTSGLGVINNADGRLEVFGRGTDGAMWHIWQQPRPMAAWSNWASLGGGITSAPALGRNKDGRLEAFVRGTNGAVFHCWQTGGTPSWSGWDSLGGVVGGDQAVASNQDGRMQLFACGSDLGLWNRWQTAPSNGWN
ncbi:C1 family peptidase [Variovorax rhizosphaerae]|uniref:C1 family peptidase n=1 Tax=Variovorax rhizosphaerae TaxID=1836200 RepID=A0ABU8WMG8_9BURK